MVSCQMIFSPQNSGLANCRYVAHQSDRQGQNKPKGYIGRQDMTPEIAHMYVNRLQNGIVSWIMNDMMQNDPNHDHIHRLHKVFFWCPF